jgi:1,4-dihydroxy-2-naphthoate octaprenyltransferase
MHNLYLLTAGCPVFLAMAMAYGDGVHDLKMGLLCLMLVLSLQYVINPLIFRPNRQPPPSRWGSGQFIAFAVYGIIPLAVCYYLQSSEMNPAVIIAGLSCGFFGVMVNITKNEYLYANVFGGSRPDAARNKSLRYVYTYSLLIALLTPVGIYLMIRDHAWILLCPFLLFLSIPTVQSMFRQERDRVTAMIYLNYVIIMGYCLIFAVGWRF